LVDGYRWRWGFGHRQQGRRGDIELTKANFADLNQVDNVPDLSKRVAEADKLHTARQIQLTGGATGSVTFDGSANVTIPVTVTGGGTALTSYASQVQTLSDYPTTFPPNLSSVTPAAIGAVPTSRQIAGQPLTADMSVTTLKSSLGVTQVETSLTGKQNVDTNGALTRFCGFLSAAPANPQAGDYWFILGS
jgi:hypothetical protein